MLILKRVTTHREEIINRSFDDKKFLNDLLKMELLMREAIKEATHKFADAGILNSIGKLY